MIVRIDKDDRDDRDKDDDHPCRDDDDDGHAHDDDDDLPSVGAAAVGISPGQGLDTLLDSTQAGRWLEMKLRTVEKNVTLSCYITPSCGAGITCVNAKLGKNKIKLSSIINSYTVHCRLQESEKDHQDGQL